MPLLGSFGPHGLDGCKIFVVLVGEFKRICCWARMMVFYPGYFSYYGLFNLVGYLLSCKIFYKVSLDGIIGGNPFSHFAKPCLLFKVRVARGIKYILLYFRTISLSFFARHSF